MDVSEMTRKQFEELPHRKWGEEIICDSIILLPERTMHDCGYRNISFVAVKENEAICIMGGRSDVVHFDGIGGYGYEWLKKYSTVPRLVPVAGWNIDCLPKSGLFRIFCDGEIICAPEYSSFEIYFKARAK